MAAKKGFEGFESVFGEVVDPVATSEDGAADVVCDAPFRRSLFLARVLDSEHLEVVVTDFHSHTYSRVLAVHDLEDLRDDIGIAGSWSEFVDYFRSSLSSGDLKLAIGDHTLMGSGTAHAKLLAFKAKGLPRISLSLYRVVNASANNAMATLSLALFEACRNSHMNIVKEQERSSQLMKIISSEREKSDNLQRQLDSLSFLNKRKAPKLTTLDKTSNHSDSLDNYEKTMISEIQPSEVSSIKATQVIKTAHRPAPVSRRARVRGVTLQDTSDNDDS